MNRLFVFLGLVILLQALALSSAQQSSVICTVCTGVIAFAEPYARAPINMQEADLQVLMHAYCNEQSGLQNLCKDMVDRFMHFIFGMFLQSSPPLPHAICLDIRACTS
uniref:Saposin B-type domain-containing protein n=1 Tax=Plectus sambesii TaxID=2011161 RepID=A0A914WRF8_9BILA